MRASQIHPILKLDPDREIARLERSIREIVFQQLGRKGVVVGLSGGVDSTLVAKICVLALGPERVRGLLMPEAESSSESLTLGCRVAEELGIRYETEDITTILEAAGCYRRRDQAVQSMVPEFQRGDKCKIVLPGLLEQAGYRLFSVVVERRSGERIQTRLSLDAYQGLVAATNFKQRVRKMMEYYYADLLRFAVAGTPNRLEYDQGFFVKNGDGSADLKPIAHLYKSQVYQLADYLELPPEILSRPPTTDTYSMEQSQEEFYFSLPFHQLDLCLFGKTQGMSSEEVADLTGLSTDQVMRVFRDIDGKRKAARYLHSPALLIEPVNAFPPQGSKTENETKA